MMSVYPQIRKVILSILPDPVLSRLIDRQDEPDIAVLPKPYLLDLFLVQIFVGKLCRDGGRIPGNDLAVYLKFRGNEFGDRLEIDLKLLQLGVGQPLDRGPKICQEDRVAK